MLSLFYIYSADLPLDDMAQPDEDYHFVHKHSDDYYCPILSILLLEPHLTACCGKHLSEKTVRKIQHKHRNICPLCNTEPLITMKDNYFRRQVRESAVFCSNKSRGCKWVAELSSLKEHMEECCYKFGTPAPLKHGKSCKQWILSVYEIFTHRS